MALPHLQERLARMAGGFRAAADPAAAHCFCSRPRITALCLFRYRFDSSKARQTVRWRRFRGLEFALEKGAKRARLNRRLTGAFVPWRPHSEQIPADSIRMSFTLKTPISMQQAMSGSPALARLIQMADEARACLALVRPLLPASLRGAVRAGPLQDGQWRLIVSHASAGAKLRQLSPALLAALRTKGHDVHTLHIKVQPLPAART